MNKLLKYYIKQYLKEATIPFSAEEIDAGLQHELSPNIAKDMTKLSEREVIQHIMKNLDDRTCISFVNKYDEKPPSFNINPTAAYNTPHGNYAYTLNLRNFRSLYKTMQVRGSEFAINRPYFLLFRIKSPDIIILDEEGNDNYKEISKNKRTSFEKDIERISRSFAYYVMSGYRSKPEGSKFDQIAFDRAFNKLKVDINDKFEEMINSSRNTTEFIMIMAKTLQEFFKRNVYIIEDFPEAAEEKITNVIRKSFEEIVTELSLTDANKFYKGDSETSDFHRLNYGCFLLANIAARSTKTPKSTGPIFTIFLKEAGIDGIIDHGSKTVHQSEPAQAVSLNFGNINANDIEFLGTFNNVFKYLDPEDFEDIVSMIYKEEGFSYDVDVYSSIPKEERTKSGLQADIYDSGALQESVEAIASKYQLNVEVFEVEIEDNSLVMYLKFICESITSKSKLFFYDALMLYLSNKYKNFNYRFHLAYEIESKNDVTDYFKQTFTSSGFKKLTTHHKSSIDTFEIYDWDANSAYIDLDKSMITPLYNLSQLKSGNPFINLISNNVGEDALTINIKDKDALNFVLDIFNLQDSDHHVIIDITKGNFSKDEIETFKEKYKSKNAFTTLIG